MDVHTATATANAINLDKARHLAHAHLLVLTVREGLQGAVGLGKLMLEATAEHLAILPAARTLAEARAILLADLNDADTVLFADHLICTKTVELDGSTEEVWNAYNAQSEEVATVRSFSVEERV